MTIYAGMVLLPGPNAEWKGRLEILPDLLGYEVFRPDGTQLTYLSSPAELPGKVELWLARKSCILDPNFEMLCVPEGL